VPDRHLPDPPIGPDGPYLAAILDSLDRITALLDDRLPLRGPVGPAETETREPAIPPAPDDAIAVREPAPARNRTKRPGRGR